MGKKTVFTNITPLPPNVTREVAIAMLHNHDEMIELNPLVIEHHPIKTPRDAPKDEFLDCAWHEMTDRISYLPGGMVKGKVTYKGCFHDIPNGLQTHVYAPMSLDIREKWTVCGTLPGEPEEARELGLNTPRRGLYLREDGEVKCNVLMSSFVRKNLDNSHKVLVERILAKAERVQAQINLNSTSPSETSSIRGGTGAFPSFQPGSHMGNSKLVRQLSGTPTSSPTSPFAIRSDFPQTSSDSAAVHAARTQLSGRDHRTFIQELPATQPGNVDGAIQPLTVTDKDPEEIHTVHPALREQYRQNMIQNAAKSDSALLNHSTNSGNSNQYVTGTAKHTAPTGGKSFAVELEGSRPETRSSSKSNTSTGHRRGPEPIEMDGGYQGFMPNNGVSPPLTITRNTNGRPRDGSVSEMSTPVNYEPPMLNLAHMRSYSQPIIEANTYISSASSAHNMEPSSNTISSHPAVSGGGVAMNQSRFRGLSNSGGSGLRPGPNNTNANDNIRTTTITNHNQNQNSSYYTNANKNDINDSNHPDRFSMVSEISDMPTPKADSFAFGTGAVDNRFSVVSALTDGIPTPRMPSSGFADQQRQQMDREREMQRRNFI